MATSQILRNACALPHVITDLVGTTVPKKPYKIA